MIKSVSGNTMGTFWFLLLRVTSFMFHIGNNKHETGKCSLNHPQITVHLHITNNRHAIVRYSLHICMGDNDDILSIRQLPSPSSSSSFSLLRTDKTQLGKSVVVTYYLKFASVRRSWSGSS